MSSYQVIDVFPHKLKQILNHECGSIPFEFSDEISSFSSIIFLWCLHLSCFFLFYFQNEYEHKIGGQKLYYGSLWHKRGR